MANVCWSNIRIKGSKESLDMLQSEFEKAFKLDQKKTAENTWLGNLLLHMGYTMEDINSEKTPQCRGHITYFEREDKNSIQIDTDSDWVPYIEVFQVFVDKYTPEHGAKIFYNAEERGCGVFWTNDPELKDVYCIDADGLDLLPDEYSYLKNTLDSYNVEEKDLMDCLKRFVGLECNMNELVQESLIKMGNLTDERAWFSAEKYEWQEING